MNALSNFWCASRSIEEITDVFGEFEYKPVNGYVICKLCVPDNITLEELLSGGPKIPGSFQDDSGNGACFPSQTGKIGRKKKRKISS